MAHARYEIYSQAETIAEYFELADPKYAMADLRYDLAHDFWKTVEVEEEADQEEDGPNPNSSTDQDIAA